MKFCKRSQKKTYILPTIFSIMVMLMVLASCSVEGSVYRIQYPKFSFPEKPTISIPSVFDIYPDTVADNAIVVGYAEKALGDQTPITYPYTILTSAAPDSQGRYNATDLGLVPITVTTRTDLNASGATEAWWGKTATLGSSSADENTTLTTVRFVDGVTSIGADAFYKCTSLTNITIPNSVTSIGHSAFNHCDGLTSITIPNTVTSIEESTFANCTSLTSITIPNSVTSIGNNAFRGCGMTSINIPESVTSIGQYAFWCTGLTSITIPNGVTSIEDWAFCASHIMTSVTIPASVTSIGLAAFSGCLSLTHIYVDQAESSLLANAQIPSGTCTIHWNSKGPTSV